MAKVKVPKDVRREAKRFVKENNIDKGEFLKVYKQHYRNFKEDMQFETDEDVHSYTIRVVEMHFLRQGPPADEFTVVPWGYQETRETSKGELQSKIYAFDKENQKNGVIICKGDSVDAWEDITLFAEYKVRLGSQDGVFFTRDETEFEGGEPISIQPEDYIKGVVGAEEIDIKETPNKLSRKQEGSEFVDEMDVRVIEGYIDRINTFTRNGRERGVINLMDESVTGIESRVKDGIIIPNPMTVWVPASQLKVGAGSQVCVVRTVSLSDKTPQMTAYSLIPIRATTPDIESLNVD